MCFKIIHEQDNWVTCSEAWWDTAPEHWNSLEKCSSPQKSLYLSLNLPEVGCCPFWIPSPLYIEEGKWGMEDSELTSVQN